MKKNNKGFSLVELIVVIAIMAILAAVAVAGFSVYIPKAQQASDKQMVGDIEYVLNLHAQSNPEDVTAGYVILTPNGAQATSDFVTDVLVATYGDDWDTELKLAYDGWTDDGLINLVAEYTGDELELIAGSTFIASSSPEGMMNAVTNMTGLVNDVIAGTDLSKANERLNSLLGSGNSVVGTLEDLGVSHTDENYTTIVSNLLVKEMADSIQKSGTESNDLVGLMTMYSTVYAYSEQTGNDALLQEFDEILSEISYDTLLEGGACGYCEEQLEAIEGWESYKSFAEVNEEDDVAALQNMMGAVSQIAGSYTDKDSLSDANLYTSSSVSNQVNNYVNSVKALAGMSQADREVLASLPAGSIAVFITEEGLTSIVPEITGKVS